MELFHKTRFGMLAFERLLTNFDFGRQQLAAPQVICDNPGELQLMYGSFLLNPLQVVQQFGLGGCVPNLRIAGTESDQLLLTSSATVRYDLYLIGLPEGVAAIGRSRQGSESLLQEIILGEVAAAGAQNLALLIECPHVTMSYGHVKICKRESAQWRITASTLMLSPATVCAGCALTGDFPPGFMFGDFSAGFVFQA